MSTLLTNLENNEAVLLMYLANELPAEDRTEVEAMLDRDAQMRDQLDAIRAGYESLKQMMNDADATVHLHSGFSSARAVGDAVRAKHAAMPSLDDKDEYRRRFSMWWYPVAAAAMLALGMLMWWQSATEIEKQNGLPNQYSEDSQVDPSDQPYVTMFDSPPQDPVQVKLQNELEVVTYLRSNDTFW